MTTIYCYLDRNENIKMWSKEKIEASGLEERKVEVSTKELDDLTNNRVQSVDKKGTMIAKEVKTKKTIEVDTLQLKADLVKAKTVDDLKSILNALLT